MGGFFGAVSRRDCVLDIFFGADYHSHLGTRRGGMVIYDQERGFQRQIHNIENTPFRTKFEKDIEAFRGCSGIGCISDTDPQPLLVRSHLGLYAIAFVGIINNAEALVDTCFSDHGHQFMAMSSGKVNQTELVAALISQKDTLVEGIRHAQGLIDGSATILLLTPEGILAARDGVGRLPILVGKGDEGCCVSFESFAYHKLGYADHYELGPGEIVRVTPEGVEQLAAPGEKMKICAFLWTYYGYPNSNYEGKNVEVMRYRNGQIMARDEMERGTLPEVDYVAGVPDSGLPHAIGYSNQSQKPFARPFVKYTPTWPRSFMPSNQNVRNQVAKMKQIPVPELIQDKKLLFVDDSIVRGTQLRETPAHYVRLQIPELLRQQLGYGALGPARSPRAGGRRRSAASGGICRQQNGAGPVPPEIHLPKDGLRLPGLPVSGWLAGSHRPGPGSGLHLLLDRERMRTSRFHIVRRIPNRWES